MILCRSSVRLAASVLALCLIAPAQAQSSASPSGPPSTSPPDAPVPAKHDDANQQSIASTQSERDRAAEQVKQQEKQRIAGVVPEFQRLVQRRCRSVVAQTKAANSPPHRHRPRGLWHRRLRCRPKPGGERFRRLWPGSSGICKAFRRFVRRQLRWHLVGQPNLSHLVEQDPRYFRRGTGSFTSRFLYSVSTTVWCKNDNGKWGTKNSNILGNLAAGGISNLYYPASDRGAGLTFERGFTVTAYGAFGGIFNEFWPDIAKKILKNKMAKLQLKVLLRPLLRPDPRLHFRSITTIRPSDSKLPPVAVFAVVSGLLGIT